MTKDQLARWKSMGFPFDEFYDTIAKETPAVKPELTIKFVSATQDEKFYTVKLAFTINNFKSKEAVIFLEIVPNGLSFVRFGESKTITFSAESNTFDYKFPVDPFDDSKYEGQNFYAKLIYEGLSAETGVFQIGKKEENDKKIDNFGRKDVKDLQPSSKFYLWIKEKEGLGYNLTYENNEIVKIYPYDDGGKMGKGNATIGYGHLIDKKPFDVRDEKHKKWKDGITIVEANSILKEDVDSKSKLTGIKVKLLQREYDALVMAKFNGGYGDVLERTINKGVGSLSKEEIFKAFLTRRFDGKIESRGLIKRRAMEADIFVNDNWMPFPSDKFKNDNEYIAYFKEFLKTGLLPLIFIVLFLTSCNNSNNINDVQNKKINENSFQEYQKNDILIDDSDDKLMSLDTVLSFSDKKNLYKVTVKKQKIKIIVYRWEELPDNKVSYIEEGFQKNGFIYIKNKENKYELIYKIVFNKGLFYWNDSGHWELINSGSS